jgi:hypothetical protein
VLTVRVDKTNYNYSDKGSEMKLLALLLVFRVITGLLNLTTAQDNVTDVGNHSVMKVECAQSF